MHAAGVKAASDLRDLQEAHGQLKEEHQIFLQTLKKATELKGEVADLEERAEPPRHWMEIPSVARMPTQKREFLP
jgi:hypothetical protein